MCSFTTPIVLDYQQLGARAPLDNASRISLSEQNLLKLRHRPSTSTYTKKIWALRLRIWSRPGTHPRYSPMNLSLYQIQGILVLDTAGQRIFARYYSPPHSTASFSLSSAATQKSFERDLFGKTKKQNSDVILFDNRVVCYKSSIDLIFYTIAGPEENELMIYAVVMAIREALEMLLRVSVDKTTLLENYDLLSLVVDEVVDDGIVLETDAVTISTRISRAPVGGENGMPLDFSEKGLMNAYQMAKQKLRDQILQ